MKDEFERIVDSSPTHERVEVKEVAQGLGTYPIKVGEKWVIWITGNTDRLVATVVQVDPPRLRVSGSLGYRDWPLLKDGDFVLIEKIDPSHVCAACEQGHHDRCAKSDCHCRNDWHDHAAEMSD